ncbi:hypothetical protein [Halegenticoccus tardaugens]|uniref:hypothetical protein n=1 Tax=Halegenticoccus tardaugens TaxID=2071624 RepID=UPI00100BA8BD|nr:hypothetical protein [Halegenticoccus tardaugens]
MADRDREKDEDIGEGPSDRESRSNPDDPFFSAETYTAGEPHDTSRRVDEILYEKDPEDLADDEGFWCAECGWRGSHAPMFLEKPYEPGDPICYCPECEAPDPQTGGPASAE